jgi:small subunit ribosomal protein S5
LLRAAPSGTGIIAAGPIRAACEVMGIQDIVAKSLGSSNPHNIIKACLQGLKNQKSPKSVSENRGKKISEIIKNKESA